MGVEQGSDGEALKFGMGQNGGQTRRWQKLQSVDNGGCRKGFGAREEEAMGLNDLGRSGDLYLY